MMAVFRQRMIWITFAIWGSFWLWRPLLSRTHVFDVVNGIAAALSFGVVLVYGRGAWRSLKVPVSRWPFGAWLVFGVTVSCTGFLILRGWLFTARWFQIEGVATHPFSAWMIWVISSGYVMHVMSNAKGQRPAENLPMLAALVLAGLLFGLITVVALG